MKNYVKPTVDVVELSVKENMAVLPVGIGNPAPGSVTLDGQDYVSTVYDLTALNTSNEG